MKKTILNTLLWLTAAIFACILWGILSQPDPTQQDDSALPPEQLSALMQSKQQLQADLLALRAERDAVQIAPSSLLILFDSQNEQQLSEAFALMDEYGYPGLIGLRADQVEKLQAGELPAWLSPRLAREWAFCLFPENSAELFQMQKALADLGYPVTAAFLTDHVYEELVSGSMLPALSECGIHILLHESAAALQSDLPFWHILGTGNMSGQAYSLYVSRRSAGNAIAFIVGDHRTEDRYVRGNLAALLQLLKADAANGAMQCLPLDQAYQVYVERETLLAEKREYWTRTEAELNEQLARVQEQIAELPME